MGCNGTCARGVENNVSIQPGIVNYCVVRGDGFADVVTIESSPGVAANLASPARTFVGQLRKSANSDAIVYTFDIDMSDAANGSFTFSIPESVTAGLTGEFAYDIEQTIAPSTSPRTILAGCITFSPDVTR